ncbi:Krab-a domain-containing protein [Elysia marginata]|uniref:Krab-a domain-containing protein n=1 Tax=Elysia marginata TaxID=1093978 RepID=A0AAV4EKX2_9GAST|nr:Krab-a domain-containing protein [Elysia marginata]
MDLVHRSGRQHGKADSLSRRPFQACVEATVECLPCGGCNYCRRIERKWIKFKEEVDDVIPLSSGTLRAIQPSGTPASADQPPTLDQNLPNEQQRDDDVSTLTTWLTGRGPDEGLLAISSPVMWMSRQLFIIKNGVLYRHNPKSNRLQVVVRRHLVVESLKLAHDIPSAGHQGVCNPY